MLLTNQTHNNEDKTNKKNPNNETQQNRTDILSLIASYNVKTDWVYSDKKCCRQSLKSLSVFSHSFSNSIFQLFLHGDTFIGRAMVLPIYGITTLQKIDK